MDTSVVKKATLTLLAAFFFVIGFCQSVAFVPLPVKSTVNKGTFVISPNTVIVCRDGSDSVAETATFLSSLIQLQTNFSLPTATFTPKANYIELTLKNNLPVGNEGYLLNVLPNRVEITANTAAGLFYGVQSLAQLFPWPEKPVKRFAVKSVAITDFPRFRWRGAMLDVSRHFFTKETVKKLLDLMAMYKLNIFHWHLSDNEGWRVEIKKYPLLTTKGAWREEKKDPYDLREPADPKRKTYGGFYTRDDIKEVVRYAAKLHILVVPEIDMPGHTKPVTDAYPELACAGKPFAAPVDGHFLMPDPLCVGNEKTFLFVEDILTEIIGMFPGRYIHIGGDEVRKDAWEKCEKCKRVMQQEKIATTSGLQSYFNKTIEKYLASRDRQLIGWDEILDGGLSPNATVMSWQGTGGGAKAANMGHDVVMAPYNNLYLAKKQSVPAEDEYPNEELLTLRDVYNFDPLPSSINNENKKHILGLEACLWTEFVRTPEQVERRLLPRLCAVSEIAWSNTAVKNWGYFLKRINKQYPVLDRKKYSYFIPFPDGLEEEMLFTDKIRINLASPISKARLYYTTDRTEPGINAKRFSSPFTVSKNAIIKARTYLPSIRKWSHTKTAVIEKIKPRAAFSTGKSLKNGLVYRMFNGNIFSDHFDPTDTLQDGTTRGMDGLQYPESGEFSILFEGLIKINTTGVYSFVTVTDGVVDILLDDGFTLENAGYFAGRKAEKKVGLAAGFHKIKIRFHTIYAPCLLDIKLDKITPEGKEPVALSVWH